MQYSNQRFIYVAYCFCVELRHEDKMIFTDDDEKPCFIRDSRTLDKPSVSIWEAMGVADEAVTVTVVKFSWLEGELAEFEASWSKLETKVELANWGQQGSPLPCPVGFFVRHEEYS